MPSESIVARIIGDLGRFFIAAGKSNSRIFAEKQNNKRENVTKHRVERVRICKAATGGYYARIVSINKNIYK